MDTVHVNVGVQMIAHILAVYAQESDQVKSFVGSGKQVFKVFDELGSTIIHKLMNNPDEGEEVLAMIQDSINYIRYADMPIPELTDDATHRTFLQTEDRVRRQLKKQQAKRAKKELKKNEKL